MSHTPAPWHNDGAMIWSGDKVVAQAALCPECIANARLIAAAPELLSALKKFMDIWGSRDANSFAKRAQSRRATMWELANAAVSKVEQP